jgi:hypothetical protein
MRKINEVEYFFLKSKLDQYTVKAAHALSSIKQSPVLKGHPFLVPS